MSRIGQAIESIKWWSIVLFIITAGWIDHLVTGEEDDEFED